MVGVGRRSNGRSASFRWSGFPDWSQDQRIRAGYNEIGPRYFETLRMPILRRPRVRRSRHAAVAARRDRQARSLARRLWPNGSTRLARRSSSGPSSSRWSASSPMRASATAMKICSPSRRPLRLRAVLAEPASVDSSLAIRVAGDPAAMLPALMRESRPRGCRCADRRNDHAAHAAGRLDACRCVSPRVRRSMRRVSPFC